MKTDTENENWRKKYFDSLNSLENEQRQFRAMEATLKRLAGRLCSASLGQSTRLDGEIKKLQKALRREASHEELEKITPDLTDAIQALDYSGHAPEVPAAPLPAPPPPQPVNAQPAPAQEIAIDDERVRAVLSSLLVELKRDTELAEQAEALGSKLAGSLTREQLAAVLSSLAEMVARRIQRVEQAKAEIEVLLSHMVGRLDEIGQFVAEQNRSQSESHASSETLNIKLADEMKAMGESVESAHDMQQIRQQVRRRLDSIDRHLQDFRQREAALASEMQERNEQMRSRIVELEAKTKSLHEQLSSEQRLAANDALTRIPNRLAYEKRMEEELQRWQRFKQPTCIAVWDIDHFKRVNDTYGHRAGDRLLRNVAECLSGRIRSTDFVARYGGEEFVMILPGTKLDDAVRLVDEMRTAIANIGYHFRGTPLSVTISSGVTALAAGDSAGTAFDRADKALYKAKETGRNRCVSL